MAAATAPFDLPEDTTAQPLRPISLIAAIRFLAALSAREGPDLPTRAVGPSGILEIASLAPAVSGARTPREVLARAARDFPRHATHEFFTFEPVSGGMAVRDAFALQLPADAIHAAQCYEAALICRVLAWTGLDGPLLRAVEVMPHPIHGLAHMEAALGVSVTAAAGRRFAAIIPDSVLDAPLRLVPQGPVPTPAPVLSAPDLTSSATLLLRAMLLDGGPSLERLMEAAGRSRRTLQRQFLEEGTSFKQLLDAVRRDEALGRLGGPARVTDVAIDLGYASPSGLTRAVRRWTQQTPRGLRRSGLA